MKRVKLKEQYQQDFSITYCKYNNHYNIVKHCDKGEPYLMLIMGGDSPVQIPQQFNDNYSYIFGFMLEG